MRIKTDSNRWKTLWNPGGLNLQRSLKLQHCNRFPIVQLKVQTSLFIVKNGNGLPCLLCLAWNYTSRELGGVIIQHVLCCLMTQTISKRPEPHFQKQMDFFSYCVFSHSVPDFHLHLGDNLWCMCFICNVKAVETWNLSKNTKI